MTSVSKQNETRLVTQNTPWLIIAWYHLFTFCSSSSASSSPVPDLIFIPTLSSSWWSWSLMSSSLPTLPWILSSSQCPLSDWLGIWGSSWGIDTIPVIAPSNLDSSPILWESGDRSTPSSLSALTPLSTNRPRLGAEGRCLCLGLSSESPIPRGGLRLWKRRVGKEALWSTTLLPTPSSSMPPRAELTRLSPSCCSKKERCSLEFAAEAVRLALAPKSPTCCCSLCLCCSCWGWWWEGLSDEGDRGSVRVVR